MITVDKERTVKDNKVTVKVRASIEMNVEILGNMYIENVAKFAMEAMANEIKNQSFNYDDFNYEVLEINKESSIEEKVNYVNKEI